MKKLFRSIKNAVKSLVTFGGVVAVIVILVFGLSQLFNLVIAGSYAQLLASAILAFAAIVFIEYKFDDDDE